MGQAAAVAKLVEDAGVGAVAVINDFGGIRASCAREGWGSKLRWKK